MSYLALKLDEAREALADAEHRAQAAEEALERLAEATLWPLSVLAVDLRSDAASTESERYQIATAIETIADAIEAEVYPQEDRT